MPSRQLFANNAQATLAGGLSNVATSVTVQTGQGARFGSTPGANEFIRATLRNAAGSVIEIVNITAIVSDTLTIVRAQEGTTGQAFSSGDTISVRWTAAGATRMAQKDANESITGAWSFPAPTGANDVANKSYVDQFRTENLTAETALVDADTFPFYDASATAARRITAVNLRKGLMQATMQSAFRAVSAAATSIPNNTNTNILLAAESFDAGNNFASNQYTVPRTGLYLINATGYVTGTPSVVSTLTFFVRVDTGYYYFGASLMQNGFSQTHSQSGTLLLYLSAGQTIGLTIHHNAGVAMSASAGSSNLLAGFFLGEF